MYRCVQGILIGLALMLSGCATLDRENTIRLVASPRNHIVASCFERTHSDTFQIKLADGVLVTIRFSGSSDFAFIGPLIVPIIPTQLPFSSTQRFGLSLHLVPEHSQSNVRGLNLSTIRMVLGDQGFAPIGLYDRRWGEPLSSASIDPFLRSDAYLEFELPKMGKPTSATLVLEENEISLEISRSWLYTPMIMGDNTRDFSRCKM